MSAEILKSETSKPVRTFVADFISCVTDRGFVVLNHETMDMKLSFANHGVEVDGAFDLHMVQVCKPPKAAKSLSTNPERAPLMPKFVMVFSKNCVTQVRMLRYHPQLVSTLVDDADFPLSLDESFTSLASAIESTL